MIRMVYSVLFSFLVMRLEGLPPRPPLAGFP